MCLRRYVDGSVKETSTPATAVVIMFIDEDRDRFRLEPICRVLTQHGCKIAPSSYYAARTGVDVINDGVVAQAQRLGLTAPRNPRIVEIGP